MANLTTREMGVLHEMTQSVLAEMNFDPMMIDMIHGQAFKAQSALKTLAELLRNGANLADKNCQALLRQASISMAVAVLLFEEDLPEGADGGDFITYD